MIEKGFKDVKCNVCGAEGQVYVGKTLRNGEVKVDDYLDHGTECPFFKLQQPRHLRKKNWRGQEKRANSLVGARETLASGAVGEDGDGRRIHEWRVESKQTVRSYFNLRQDVWSKLVRGALRNGEEPLLHVELQTTLNPTYQMVVMRLDLYEALTGDRNPPCYLRQQNKVSWRIEHSVHPQMIRLDPVGVAVTEAEFKVLKERL